MSLATQTNQATAIQEQSVEATTKIKASLGITELSTADLKRLSAALSVAAAEELPHNTRFALRIKGLFEEMTPKKAPVKNKKKSASDVIAENDLVPVATGINYEFDPFAPPDPYFLVKLYGSDQLPKALDRYSLTRLKETIKTMAMGTSSVKPKAKATKGDLINFIVSQVAN